MASFTATYHPTQQDEASFSFNAPSLSVNQETYQAIQGGYDPDAELRLRIRLADATRESCRLAIKNTISSFDFRNDANNCDVYTESFVSHDGGSVEAADDDLDPGPAYEMNPICQGVCLLEQCDGYDTGGGFDDPPTDPLARIVHCECKLEQMGDCSGSYSGDLPQTLWQTTRADYCVPEGAPAADYCRISVADYYNASVRALNHYGGVIPFEGYVGTCGDFEPASYNVVVTCVPIMEPETSIDEQGDEAYSEQNDICAPGCSSFACDDLQNTDPTRPCTIDGEAGCNSPNCQLASGCDCDILPSPCFEGDVVEGVCLPDPIGGADGGSDDGGGSGRLRSAINLLSGTWLGTNQVACSEIEPGSSFTSLSNLPPSSAVSPYALTNGTSFTTGLHHTCAAPTTDDVTISTFDATLEELCRLIPLCSYSNDLSLTITATEGTTQLASGTLSKSGSSITTNEAGAPLSVGDHTLDLCVEHDPTGITACSAQSIRASAPLGSGVDGYGYFAGELAPDFVPIAGKPGATQLSLTDDGYLRVFLPSGFTFPFYGTTVSSYLWVGANGGINTSPGSVARSNSALPATGANTPDIAVYWDDLDPSSSGGVYTWFDGARFIVSWEDVPHGRDGSSSTTNGVSVQAHIHDSGRIELHYLDTEVGETNYDHGKSATLGIENTLGTLAVEISHDDAGLLTAGVAAVGLSLSSKGCLADGLVIPPQVACVATDHYATVCTPTGDSIELPLPDLSQCATSAVGIAGKVIESGSTEASLAPLSAPTTVGASGTVTLDEGVHRVQWWPTDALGQQEGATFTQLVFVRTWVHTDCGSSSQSMTAFTEEDDTFVATPQASAVTLLGLPGEDLLVSSAGDDFIGDGPGAGICEANDGDDTLVGEDGDDTLDGGSGHDRAWGGTGDDLLVGAAGHDVLHGQDGHDLLQGDDGDDVLWGGRGDDVLEGDDGADTLYPGSGVDLVYGGAGDDILVFLDACELTSGMLLSGGSGNDTLLLPPGLDAQDLAAAGVTVDADIETITTSSELSTHRASCEPS